MTREQIIAQAAQELTTEHIAEQQLPDVESLRKFVELCRTVIFPEYYSSKATIFTIGQQVEQIYDILLCQTNEQVAAQFTASLAEIKRLIMTDVSAVYDCDPAATSHCEVIFCYPAIIAILYYRIANRLVRLGVEIIPRIISEMAHSSTGIDIHPRAEIGERFSIDHGTGVVIGETTIIGRGVRLYQGVTLGARSFRTDENGNPINTPRHPIIGDDVIIYSNASILGRIEIGKGTIIGGNVWVTESTPPYSKITQSSLKRGEEL